MNWKGTGRITGILSQWVPFLQ